MTDTVLRYFTFGTDHNDRHPRLGITGRLIDGYITVEAPTQGMARDIGFAILGPAFAFDYDEVPGSGRPENWYPEGELLRIAWLSQDRLREARAALTEAAESEEADGFDVVFDARDTLAAALTYTTGVYL